jgi:hypothetical protein
MCCTCGAVTEFLTFSGQITVTEFLTVSVDFN